MYTYEYYRKMPWKSSFEELNKIHETLCEEVQTEDEDFLKIWRQVLKKAYDYSEFRMQWFIWEKAERLSNDDLRTSTHDTWIAYLNMLDRYMDRQGWKHTWRGMLGDNRKVIGDFAVFLMFVYGLNAR